MSDNRRGTWWLRVPEKCTWSYRFTGQFINLALSVLVRRRWSDGDKIPATGSVLIVGNHISYFDPPVFANFIMGAGRWPHFLAKVELWDKPFIGALARSTEQIPVRRGTSQAGESLVLAERSLAKGQVVAMYPEGTVTRDPDLWPMNARSGAARLALATGCTVIPVGQFGANDVMPGTRAGKVHFFPKKTVSCKAGDPVDLSDLSSSNAEDVTEASDRIMKAITALVADVRGEPAPTGRYDMRAGRRI